MKIKYESTIDEAVVTQLRLIELSKTLRKIKWEGLFFIPIIFIAVYFIISGKMVEKLTCAVFASIIFIPIYIALYKLTIKKRIRKLLIESFGTDKPVPSEYEFVEDGLIFRKLGVDIKFEWNKVTEINEDEKMLEFIIGKKGLALIPKRIFENEQQKNEWLNYAKQKTNIS